ALLLPAPPSSPLFPYTTLFRSRVAAAAREGGERRAFRIAFRTGGVAGMFTVGLGLLGAAIVVLIYKANAPGVLEGFGLGATIARSEEHTSELQSLTNLVCRLLL